MDREYVRAYSQLNEAQKKAVDVIDGPMLVIAGPGTGKTQLLSLRIANILKQTDTDPSSILCLTFTNFAATNMQERLNSFVGLDAHKVQIKTFHSFAAELMALYPEYFWNGARLSVVPEAVQLDILQEILTKLPLSSPLSLRFSGNYTAINDVQRGLQLTKEAGLTPQKLTAIIKHNEAYIKSIEPKLIELLDTKLSVKKLDALQKAVEDLPNQDIDETIMPLISLSSVIKKSLAEAIKSDEIEQKTTKTSAWKRQWLQTVNSKKGMFDERRRNAWWIELSKVYASYRNELHSRGYYDYADMIVEVISQLEQNPELLASVQERFLYVLIDEFQDTNAAQLRLAYLVAANYTEPSKPNLIAVGDDDQSIFAFNGAELSNALAFKNNFPSLKTVVLTDNYRSNQAILDTAQSIIEQADDRLINRLPDLNKNLKATKETNRGQLEHQRYPTREHQLSGLAKAIKAEQQKHPLSSIAVLARSHSSLRDISRYLKQEGVSIRYEQQNNILDYELINQIKLLAETVVAIGQGDERVLNYSLSRLLSHPAWRIKPFTLWQLAINSKTKNVNWLDSLLTSKLKPLAQLANWLLWLSQTAKTEPLAVTLEYLIGLRAGAGFTSPLEQYFVSSRPVSSDYLEALSGLNIIESLVREFIGSNVGSPKLEDLVNFLSLAQSLGRPLVDESWFVSSDKAVQLLTIHKAKGLEFDTVYIVDAVEGDWKPKHIGRKPPANLPLKAYGEQFDDYARLAYVAATRSRRSLIVTSYSKDQKDQPVLASPLFSNLKVKQIQADTKSKDSLHVLESSIAWPKLQSSDAKALLTPIVANYKLTATGLIQFLDVVSGGPQLFLERQLLRLPQLMTTSLAFGNAIHSSLQLAQNIINNDKYNFNEVLKGYEKSLVKQQLPSDQLKRYLNHGHNVLKRLLDQKEYILPKGAKPELMINLSLGKAKLNGILDNANVVDNQLIITDFKTGTALRSFDTKAKNSAHKAWQHKTQLLFYALLAQKDGRFKDIKTTYAQTMYVEAEGDKPLTLKLEPSEEELARVEKLIESIWLRIQNLDFKVPDYPETIEGIKAFEAELVK